MPQFAYYGRNANREPMEGKVEAASVAAVEDAFATAVRLSFAK